MPKQKQPSFEELVNHYVSYTMTQLIEKGGNGLKSAMWLAMSQAITWREAVDKETKQQKKGKADWRKFNKV